MFPRVSAIHKIIAVLFFGSPGAFAQNHQLSLQLVPEQCTPGGAILNISDITSHDSIGLSWSSGQKDIIQANNLSAGNYQVHVKIVTKKDSVRHVRDTTLAFNIEKEPCPVIVPKYFSPNDDGYNDLLTIGYIENYPEFELIIYNKWGQRVHHQQKTYIPWDGKWLGSNLPDGTYYLVLFYKKGDNGNLYKSDITILR
jgi:gliding motility-associated-like protein